VSYASREKFIVRVLVNGSAGPAGVGFMVGKRHVVTCAHVVNYALGRPSTAQECPLPETQVSIDFPLLASDRRLASCKCQVNLWLPPPDDGLWGGDIAGLVVSDGVIPEEAETARLIDSDDLNDQNAKIYGFPGNPPRRVTGSWSTLVIRGTVSGGGLQLDAAEGSAIQAQPGFSGSPVVVRGASGDMVAGMLVVAGRGGSK
jgi:hypothetical protein